MKRFLNILAAVLISAVISTSSVVAQSRSGRGTSPSSQHKNAPASHTQPGHGDKNSGGQSGSSRNERRASSTQQVKASDNKRPAQNNIRPSDNGMHKNQLTGKRPVDAIKPTPAADNRPGNSGSPRPGNGGHGHDNNSATRPGNPSNRPNDNGGSNRPNSNNHPSNNNRPNSNNHPSNNGGNHTQPGKPGTPPSPAYGYGPGGDRWHGKFHDIPHHAPHRPMLPPPPPHFYRPVPPPAFRPAPNAPRFGTILGIALGSAINYTLNQLFNTGYYVTGYTQNAIYLNDVLMLNMVWPNATLQYDRGLLTGSEFVYPSPFYDTDIYYRVYNTLQSSYGIPASMEYLAGGGMQASWFGYDGRYVSLTYQSGTALDGQMRFYTTLSFGN